MISSRTSVADEIENLDRLKASGSISGQDYARLRAGRCSNRLLPGCPLPKVGLVTGARAEQGEAVLYKGSSQGTSTRAATMTMTVKGTPIFTKSPKL